MSDFLLYLLETQLLLALLFGLYLLFLRHETFFQFNRFFLMLIVVVSAVFPAVELNLPAETSLSPAVAQMRDFGSAYFESVGSWVDGGGALSVRHQAENQLAFHWIEVIGLVYWIGVAITLGKLFWAYYSLVSLKRRSDIVSVDETQVVTLPFWVAPFSFFKYVFVHRDFLDSSDFAGVLSHEKVHLEQYHTLDLMFVQLFSAFCWFNPVIWQLHKFIKINHEYIADHEMLKRGYSLVEYQTLLLSQIVSNNSYGLVHNFNLSFIKKRITMMNMQKTGKAGIVKYVLVASLGLLIAAGMTYCTTKTDQDPGQLALSSVKNASAMNVVLPQSNMAVVTSTYDPENALTLRVQNGNVYLEQRQLNMEQLPEELVNQTRDESTVIRLMVDAQQSMGVIRSVYETLRTANRRKISLVLQDAARNIKEMPMLLPPANTPGQPIVVPDLTPEYIAEHDLDALFVTPGEDTPQAAFDATYALVMRHLSEETSNYVVGVRYADNDRFGDYLNKVLAVNAAFNQIYDERAQQLFATSFDYLAQNREADPEIKTKFDEVRKGIPRAIWMH